MSQTHTCIIIGAGIAGPATALSLLQSNINPTIYELRPSFSEIGGALQLPPNALRLLSHLGIDSYSIPGCEVEEIEMFSLSTGKKLGGMSFDEEKGRGRRVMRSTLQKELLKEVENMGIGVVYGKKLIGIEEREEKVTARFEDGTKATADFLIGGDGIHSSVRSLFVETERKPVYTGASGAYSLIPLRSLDLKPEQLHFKHTALNMSRYGAVITTFVDKEKENVWVGIVMETPEEKGDGRDVWKVSGKEKETVREEVRKRYEGSVIDCVPKLVNAMEDVVFFPIWKLPPGGNWSRGRVVLVGDAAHAMPPQGDSVGLALEDAVLLARVFREQPERPVQEVFQIYRETRRVRVDKGFKDASLRWEHVKDKGWLRQKVYENFMWGIFWLKGESFQDTYAYDVREEKLQL